MIKLNLLPEKVRSAVRMRLIVLLGVVVYILVVAVLGWLWMQSSARVKAAQQEVDAIYAELNSPQLQETVKAVEKFTRDQEEMKAKASTVNAVRRRQATLLRFYDVVPDWTLNGAVWITSFEIQDAGSGRKVALEGSCMSPTIFAKFYSELETQPLVKDLKLESMSPTSTERGRVVTHFKVTFTGEEFQ